ncbi:hypothetical protein [Glycomyces sp. YM15]|nr:hypothetical protein [Glycomyces sp. YM15]
MGVVSHIDAIRRSATRIDELADDAPDGEDRPHRPYSIAADIA